MAQAQIQVQKQKIFASVFPRGSVKPPINHQHFAAKADDLAKEAEETLRQGSRIILGIGGDGIAFGNVNNVGADGDAIEAVRYWTLYVNSCPMESVRDEMLPHLLEEEARKWDNFRLWNLASKWTREIGGDRLRRIFAKVLEGCVTEFVSWSYAGVYEEESESQSEVVPHLRFWIRNIFARFVMRLIRAVQAVEEQGQKAEITEKDVKNWEDVAITTLGALRVSELFDIVVDWDATKSGIDDLKHYTTNPATRTFVTSSFINVLQTRLLHPGASTVEILQVYISIIRAFRRLDPKGVLLDRIARVIRRNLRERDDTAKVIVSGLLSDTTDENGDPLPPDPETLTELALELNRHDEESSVNDADLDWDNMEWMPDPIDAAPDYMKSKNTDVIGSLISLFDSKDVFVKELQTALADRLLKKKADYDQEVGVLEHLKLRFGSSSLQACEVMLRDVLDSRKVDNVIRQDQGMGERPLSPSRSATKDTTAEAEEPQFHSKILSRLFWPTLQDQPFKIPDSILAAQSRYEAGFESLKQSRKLTWLNALGHVEVELDLTDRIFKDEVLPWQAAVIYAFQSSNPEDTTAADSEPVTRTVQRPSNPPLHVPHPRPQRLHLLALEIHPRPIRHKPQRLHRPGNPAIIILLLQFKQLQQQQKQRSQQPSPHNRRGSRLPRRRRRGRRRPSRQRGQRSRKRREISLVRTIHCQFVDESGGDAPREDQDDVGDCGAGEFHVDGRGVEGVVGGDGGRGQG